MQKTFAIFANALKAFAEAHFTSGAQNSGHPGTPASEARYFARFLREHAAKCGGSREIEALAESLEARAAAEESAAERDREAALRLPGNCRYCCGGEGPCTCGMY